MREAQRSILFYAECAFVVIACFFMLTHETLLAGGIQTGNQSGEGKLTNQLILLSIFFISFLILWFTGFARALVSVRNLPLLLVLAYICTSALWSDDTYVVGRRAISLVGTSVFGAYLALRLGPVLMAHLVAVAFGIVVVASLAAVVALPQIGIHHGDKFAGAWKGVLGFKNSLAQTMTLGYLIFALAASISKTYTLSRIAYLALMAFSMMLVFGSRSGTGIIGIISLTGLMLLLVQLQGDGPIFGVRLLIIGAAAAVTTLWVAVSQFDTIISLLGKTPTLTGRTLIWDAAIRASMERPWFGEGYRAFWVGESAERVYTILSFRDFGHSHNAFIDLWLELGFVGVSLTGVLLTIYFARAIAALKHSTRYLALFPTLILAYILVFGLSARIFPQQGSMTWTVFVICWILLSERAYMAPRIGAGQPLSPSPAPDRLLQGMRV